jgi:hypothetical protein
MRDPYLENAVPRDDNAFSGDVVPERYCNSITLHSVNGGRRELAINGDQELLNAIWSV